MSIYDIRRKNLLLILEILFDGSPAKLASKIGRTTGSISRIYSKSPKSQKNLGDDLADEICKAINMERGCLDVALNVNDFFTRHLPDINKRAINTGSQSLLAIAIDEVDEFSARTGFKFTNQEKAELLEALTKVLKNHLK
jgi:hypothetical protein